MRSCDNDRYTMAEAELKNYKEFMEKTIKSYNAKLAALKKPAAGSGK